MPKKPTLTPTRSINARDIDNENGNVIIAFGDVKQTITTTTTNITSHTVTFNDVYQQIDAKKKVSKQKKEDLKAEVKDVEEAVKQPVVDESFVTRRLRNLGRMAPDILEVALAAILNPATVPPLIAARIAAKAREK